MRGTEKLAALWRRVDEDAICLELVPNGSIVQHEAVIRCSFGPDVHPTGGVGLALQNADGLTVARESVTQKIRTSLGTREPEADSMQPTVSGTKFEPCLKPSTVLLDTGL